MMMEISSLFFLIRFQYFESYRPYKFKEFTDPENYRNYHELLEYTVLYWLTSHIAITGNEKVDLTSIGVTCIRTDAS